MSHGIVALCCETKEGCILGSSRNLRHEVPGMMSRLQIKIYWSKVRLNTNYSSSYSGDEDKEGIPFFIHCVTQ